MTDLVEKVARAIYETCPMFMGSVVENELKKMTWNDLDDQDRKEAIEAARAAIAVVLKDMDEWERKLSYTERRAWSYARENGVSLDD